MLCPEHVRLRVFGPTKKGSRCVEDVNGKGVRFSWLAREGLTSLNLK